ncbi:MAG: DUF885 domain-containing protein [Longimicrobiales bacterium]
MSSFAAPPRFARLLAACGVLAVVPAPAPLVAQDAAAVAAETDRINAWFEEKFEEQLARSPIQQTFLGRKSDAIDDFSMEAAEAQLEWQRQTTAEMRERFDYDLLDEEAKTSWDVWEYQLAQAEAAWPYRYHGYVFDQMSAIHSFFPQLLISFHAVQEPADMDAYIRRIGESGRAVQQLVAVSREAARRGIRPPRFAFDMVIEEATKITSGVPFDEGPDASPVWADVTTEIDGLVERDQVDQAGAEQLRQAARSALTGPFQAAYRDLIAWQREDRPNASAVAQGVSALPDGPAYYEERLANQTTTDMTADEIHATGLAEVARLRREMTAIKDQVGFDGDLQAFFTELRDDKDNRRYYYPDTDEGRQAYIDDATAAIERIESELPNYFGILPQAGIEVRRVEAFREQDGAAQHYFPGTPDGSRPGIYYAHLSDMTSMPKRDLEVIAYHEGLPGHHMQLSIAQELTEVPTFRTQAGFTAYSEGWGLYSEWLATEMPGTYEDPLSEFGRLGSEMWRAIRLVVDTGLHAQGWTEEQAVQYFRENSSTTEGAARSEVRRYIVLPGQATSYKVGMLEIQELRRKAEEALGGDFDIRAFHDTVLGGGALPLAILEQRVDRWIASVRRLRS